MTFPWDVEVSQTYTLAYITLTSILQTILSQTVKKVHKILHRCLVFQYLTTKTL